MKKLVMETEFDYSPEEIEEAMFEQEFLDLCAEKIADVKKITLEEKTDISDTRKRYKMKYDVDPPMPGFMSKLVPAGGQSMMMIMEMDRATQKSTVEVIPGQMADKIKSSGSSTFSQKGDKWVQRMELEIEVKIKLIGGKIEKFVVGQIEDSMKKQFELLRGYMAKK